MLHAMLGFIAAIALMEALLHLIEVTPGWKLLPIVERELGWPDPTSGYALRSNYTMINVRENRARVSTNAFGMRDRERETIKLNNTYRFAVLGDLMTEALQVEDGQTFTRLAEAAMNKNNADSKIEILNFGMSGAGPVQQLSRAQTLAVRFSPDTFIAIVNVNQLLTAQMSDDSLNPAYVESADGGLELGGAFRERRSVRYRDKVIGKLFFALMDHSRLARAVYLRRAHGARSAARVHSDPVDYPCERVSQRLQRQIALWGEHEKQRNSQRLNRWLADWSALGHQHAATVVLEFYGLGELREDCPTSATLRARLGELIQRRLGESGVSGQDIDRTLDLMLGPEQVLSDLRGFGTQTGSGHLNALGHDYYARFLIEQINGLLRTQME